MGEQADILYAREEMRAWAWKQFCTRDKHWTTKDGQRLTPEQMTKAHRENVIKLVANRYFDGDIKTAINTVKLVRKMDKLNKEEI